jgi:hypothetical protein
MKRHTVLTSTYVNGFDTDGTLLAAEPFRGSHSARKGKAQWVLAVAIGILLCTMPSAGSSDIAVNKTYISYKEYALYLLDFNHKEHQCLLKLYGKESAWNPKAIGNLSGTQRVYGIPQGKSEWLKDQDGYAQVRWGLEYIGHRYGEPCIAYDHWKAKGWH